MANLGAFLTENSRMQMADYLSSPSGFFHCVLLPNGQLAIYRGPDPSNAGNQLALAGNPGPSDTYFLGLQLDGNLVIYNSAGAATWQAPKAYGTQPNFLAMQDDGNLVLYPGAVPKMGETNPIWATNQWDAVSNVAITALSYDADNATQSAPVPAAPTQTQTSKNNGDETQDPVISGSITYTQTSGWSDSIATGVQVKASLKVSVPVIADGKVEVSASITNTYQWNNSTTKSVSQAWSVPLEVPPHSEVTVTATLSTISISVPFTETAIISYSSGETLTAQISGIYTGTGGYQLDTSYSDPTPLPPGT